MDRFEEDAVVNIRICCGMECAARGAQELIHAIETDPALRSTVAVLYGQCLERCREGDHAPVVSVEGRTYTSMSADRLADLLHELVAAGSAREVE